MTVPLRRCMHADSVPLPANYKQASKETEAALSLHGAMHPGARSGGAGFIHPAPSTPRRKEGRRAHVPEYVRAGNLLIKATGLVFQARTSAPLYQHDGNGGRRVHLCITTATAAASSCELPASTRVPIYAPMTREAGCRCGAAGAHGRTFLPVRRRRTAGQSHIRTHPSDPRRWLGLSMHFMHRRSTCGRTLLIPPFTLFIDSCR
jgi:hypothetical protein